MWHVPREVLEAIPVPVLFYPSSGGDIDRPVRVFVPSVTEFWFVDFAYSKATLPTPALVPARLFEFLGYEDLPAQIAEDQIPDVHYRNEAPFVRRESYVHVPSGKPITVNRTRRRGPSALRTELGEIGVFFYRGDSSEGGTGTHWLTVIPRKAKKRQPLAYELLEKLPHCGLVVTDGSNCRDSLTNPYRSFDVYAHDRRMSGQPDIASIPPFEDLLGNRFTCVGHVGRRYGHTLVWQVSKP
jgi:hypothetical protein